MRRVILLMILLPALVPHSEDLSAQQAVRCFSPTSAYCFGLDTFWFGSNAIGTNLNLAITYQGLWFGPGFAVPGESYTFTETWSVPTAYGPTLFMTHVHSVNPPGEWFQGVAGTQIDYTKYVRPMVASDLHSFSLRTGSGSTWECDMDPESQNACFDPSTVPEPSTIFLLGSGLLGLGIVAWRRREEKG